MNRRAAFLLALLPQLAFVGWLTWQGERALAHGRLVTLRVEATAALDPLRGRSLRLEYAGCRIDAELGPHAVARERLGSHVFVEFARIGDEWSPFRYEFEPIEAAGTETVVLGATLRDVTDRQIVVDYGFDPYFIPNDGTDVHGMAPERLHVRLRVDDHGHGVIEDVLVDGVPYPEWNQRERERRQR